MTGNSRDAATKEGRLPRWHAIPVGVAIAQLASHHNGLTGAEAEGRLARHGPNRLPEEARRSALMQFVAQFHDMLVYVLIAAADPGNWPPGRRGRHPGGPS